MKFRCKFFLLLTGIMVGLSPRFVFTAVLLFFQITGFDSNLATRLSVSFTFLILIYSFFLPFFFIKTWNRFIERRTQKMEPIIKLEDSLSNVPAWPGYHVIPHGSHKSRSQGIAKRLEISCQLTWDWTKATRHCVEWQQHEWEFSSALGERELQQLVRCARVFQSWKTKKCSSSLPETKSAGVGILFVVRDVCRLCGGYVLRVMSTELERVLGTVRSS